MPSYARAVTVAAVACIASIAAACGSSSGSGIFSGSADSGGSGGSGGAGDSGTPSIFNGPDGSSSAGGGDGGCSPNLTGRLRDFVNQPGFTPASALDNDFENENGDDRGLVQTDLGADLKPVYAHGSNSTATTHGQTQFDMWYRDTPGTNMAYPYDLVLSAGAGGVQTFDNQEFFPLDGRGWNDEYKADDGNQHNFSFTFELHTTFAYRTGDTFTFTGDDDVFVFINKKLVVDLGGVHGAQSKSIQLDNLVTDDANKTPVPLVAGTTYPFDIFYNERHTVSSHFRMDTSLGFNSCTPIIVAK